MATILVIDDDPQLVHLLQVMLAHGGHEVVTAPDGRKGLALYREVRPDLVLTDILMPEQDGLETIITLRRQNADVPIIAMSGGSSRWDFLEVLSSASTLGAQKVLSKPFTRQQLFAAIDEVLGQTLLR